MNVAAYPKVIKEELLSPILDYQSYVNSSYLLGAFLGSATVILYAFYRSRTNAQNGKNSRSQRKKLCQHSVDMREEIKLVIVLCKGGAKKDIPWATSACVKAYNNCRAYDVPMLLAWKRWGQAKIALKVNKSEELRLLEKSARDKGVMYILVEDEHSKAVALAIGPDYAHVVNKITGHLKLY